MVRNDICRRLEALIVQRGSLTRAARLLGVSPQHLSAVLIGTRAIGPKLLAALGLRRQIVKTVTYEMDQRRRYHLAEAPHRPDAP